MVSALRTEPGLADVREVGRVVAATGFFSPEEIDIAVELVEERRAKGEASGYHFCLLDDAEGRLVGYTCFGPVPATADSFDLYWIAVDPAAQGHGYGRRLMAATEAEIRTRGGARLWLDTAGRAQYAPTHGFYRAVGFELAARLVDYYAPGDDKLIFGKRL